MAKLIIKKDDKLVKKMSIHDEILAFTIGSEDGNDIVISDDTVSLFHAQFEKEDSNYYVRDLQSEWGTFINGRKITGRTLLRDQDELDVGNHHLTFLETPTDSTASGQISESATEEQTQSQTNTSDSMLDRIEANNSSHGEQSVDRQDAAVSQAPNQSNGNGKHAPNLLETGHSGFPYDFDSDQTYAGSDLPAENGQPFQYTESSLSVEAENYLDNLNGRTSESAQCDSEAERQTDCKDAHYFLLGIYGYYHGRKFPIKKGETRIGRNTKLNDIVIRKNSAGETDQSVSRRQATISFEDGCYYLTDKRSKSRSLVNQHQLDVDDKIALKPGDEIEIVSDRKNHIFRLVAENNCDFSFPRKAGAWHIRFRTVMLNSYAVLFLLLFLGLVGRSIIMHQKASSRPNPLFVVESTWHTPNGERELSSGSDTYAAYPAIADINLDGVVDLAYVDRTGILRCISGISKEPLWEALDFEADLTIPISITDLNNDKRSEIIIVTNDMRVRAIDAVWGIENWQSPILAGPFVGAPVVGDFNHDGMKDVALASRQNALHIGYSNVRNARWITVKTAEPVRALAVREATDKNAAQLLVGTESGKILIVDGPTRQLLKEIDVNEELSKADGNYFNDQISHPIGVTDLNGDVTKDLLIYTTQNNMIALDGDSHERIWFNTGQGNSHSSEAPSQRMVLGDLDGDGLADVVTLTPSGGLRALKGTGDSQGRVFELWVKPQQEEYYVGHPALADFNNNGTQDVLSHTDTGTICIYEGSTGEALWQGTLELPMLVGAPVIGDLDHNSKMDVAFLSSEGTIQKLQTNRFVPADAIVWGQAENRHAHSLEDSKDSSINYAYVGPVILLNISIISLHLISALRRKRLSQLYMP